MPKNTLDYRRSDRRRHKYANRKIRDDARAERQLASRKPNQISLPLYDVVLFAPTIALEVSRLSLREHVVMMCKITQISK